MQTIGILIMWHNNLFENQKINFYESFLGISSAILGNFLREGQILQPNKMEMLNETKVSYLSGCGVYY